MAVELAEKLVRRIRPLPAAKSRNTFSSILISVNLIANFTDQHF